MLAAHHPANAVGSRTSHRDSQSGRAQAWTGSHGVDSAFNIDDPDLFNINDFSDPWFAQQMADIDWLELSAL